jgi:hypothetical protein
MDTNTQFLIGVALGAFIVLITVFLIDKVSR